MNSQRPDPSSVPLEDAQALPATDLPHLHQPIIAPADQPRTFWVEGQRPGLPAMPLESQQQLTILGSPQPDLAIIAAAGDILPVWAERHGHNAIDGLQKDGTRQIRPREIGILGLCSL